MRKTQSSAFRGCFDEGSFVPLDEVDEGRISSVFKLALIDFESVINLQKQLKEVPWNAVFKIAYDVIHMLSEAFLLFDSMKARTHECAFAYLCEKHAELEFDWYFFEKIRTIRNGSVYYGRAASAQDWKEVELQWKLYVSALKRAIEAKLKK